MLTLSDAADIDDKSSYSITLTVTDDMTDNFNKLDVTVNVVDAEEAGEVTLSAREPQVGSALIATLEDNDGGETAVRWQWYRGGVPVIDASNAGVLALAVGVDALCSATVAGALTTCTIDDETSALYTPGDDDVGHTLHAVATYQDDQGDSTDEFAGASSEKPAQEANPANTAPEFPDQDLNTAGDQSDTAMRSVAENAEEGTQVGQPLEAEDGNNDLLTYSLSGADAASFKLSKLAEDSNSVHILTDVELDFESQSMHTVVLTATDPSGAQDRITVMITVTDENDNAMITADAEYDYAEDRTDRGRDVQRVGS